MAAGAARAVGAGRVRARVHLRAAHPGTRDTVGFHVALLPLRVSLPDGTDTADAVRATGRALREADERQLVDLDALLVGGTRTRATRAP